jgi:hypothetical protein
MKRTGRAAEGSQGVDAATDQTTQRRSWVGWIADGDWIGIDRLRAVLALVFVLFGIAFAADIQGFRTHGPVAADGDVFGRDFVVEWAPPRMAWQGHAAAVYSVREFASQTPGVVGPVKESKPYAYPPYDLILAGPFSLPPYVAAYAVWTLAGLALLAAMLAGRLGLARAILLLGASPAVLFNAYSGQNGAFTAALLAGGLALLTARPLLSGVLLGLLVCKPQLAILIPIALIAGGRWRTLAAAAAAAAALAAASLALWGWGPWSAYLHNVFAGGGGAHVFGFSLSGGHDDIASTSVPWKHWRRMASVYAAVRLLGGSSAVAIAVQAVSSLAALAVTVVVWRGPASDRIKAATLAVATFAATPYAWDYDMIGLLFAALWLRDEAWTTDWRPWERPALLALLAGPIVSPFLVNGFGLNLEPILVWPVVILLFRRGRGGSIATAVPRGAS